MTSQMERARSHSTQERSGWWANDSHFHILLLLMAGYMIGPTLINLLISGRPPETLGVAVLSQAPSSPLAGRLRELIGLSLVGFSVLTLLRDRGRHISRGLRVWPLLVMWVVLWVSLKVNLAAVGIAGIATPVLTTAVASTVRDLRQLRSVAYVAGGCAALAWAMAVLLPQVGWMQTQDATKVLFLPALLAGPFGHANALGQVMALSLPFGLLIDKPGWRRGISGLIFVTLLASGSRTGLLAAAAGLLLVMGAAGVRHLRLNPLVVRDATVLALVVAVATPIWLVQTSDPGLFTGRGRIWMAARELAEGHLLIGQGPQFFNQIAQSSTGLSQAAYHAHNLLLHLYVIGGAIGLVTSAVVLGIVAARALSMVRLGVIAPAIYLVMWLIIGWLEVPYDFFTIGSLTVVSLTPWAAILAADRLGDPSEARPSAARTRRG